MFRNNTNLMIEVKIRTNLWEDSDHMGVQACLLGSDILFLDLRIKIMVCSDLSQSSQVVLMVKDLPDNAGNQKDPGSVPGLGRFPGEGNSYPL